MSRRGGGAHATGDAGTEGLLSRGYGWREKWYAMVPLKA
ncbi:hypothetical protein DB31_0375 [Hyalangium minutum]|uniref:Uncharacterized protein n=1 Tax=Hyalangium minutum TaxID=394096 RepID=A0A085WWQ1_9BACT|nr:hypothetical protein DB31_0375 [Hyalangium minutum]